MSYAKQAARLLGLMAVAALAVMAFASIGQAHKFVVGTGAFLLATAGGTQTGTSTVLILGLSAQISCTTGSVSKGHIAEATKATVEIAFTGCTTLAIKSSTEIECHVKEPVVASATLLPTLLNDVAHTPAILVEGIKALIELTEKIAAGKPLTKNPCILPQDNVFSGELCLKITAGNETKTVSVQANEAIQKECDERPTLEALTEGAGFKDKMKYGTQEVFLDASASLFLTGAHNGVVLGVLP